MSTFLLFFTSPTQGPPNQLVQRVKGGTPLQGQVWPNSPQGKGGKNHCGTITTSHRTRSQTQLNANVQRSKSFVSVKATSMLYIECMASLRQQS